MLCVTLWKISAWGTLSVLNKGDSMSLFRRKIYKREKYTIYDLPKVQRWLQRFILWFSVWMQKEKYHISNKQP